MLRIMQHRMRCDQEVAFMTKHTKKVNILGLIPQNFNTKKNHANYEINADAGFLYSNSYHV